MYKILSDVERKNCVGEREIFVYRGGILKEKERKRGGERKCGGESM
jgi:hypothetical protein